MKIRKAKKEDLDEIVEFYVKFLNYMNKFTKFAKDKKDNKINKKELKKVLNNRLKKSSRKIFLVAEENKKLQGFIGAEIMSSRESKTNKKVVEIVDIYSKNKRKGIGTKLYREIEKWAKSNGAEFIQWEFLHGNKIAEDFCIKNKFKRFRVKMLKRLK